MCLGKKFLKVENGDQQTLHQNNFEKHLSENHHYICHMICARLQNDARLVALSANHTSAETKLANQRAGLEHRTREA